MDPITIAGKFLVGKIAKELIYQHIHGMSPKEYYKFRLQLIVSAYEIEQKPTYKLLRLFDSTTEFSGELDRVASDAGATSLIDDMFSKKNLSNQFFDSPTYKFLINYEYNTEELGKTISKSELDAFFNLAKSIIRTL